jgi:hypothetical protein
MKPAVEIRCPAGPGIIDEIVAHDCNVHVEQMSADGWYMGIEASDGSTWQFWFGSKNRRSAVEFRHTETSPAEVEKKRRRVGGRR